MNCLVIDIHQLLLLTHHLDFPLYIRDSGVENLNKGLIQ